MSWFDPNEGLCIPIASSSVQFLKTPEQFYAELLGRISNSKRRIILTTLYLGTAQKEQEIVAGLRTSLDTRPDLRVRILLDYFRGTRSDPQSPDTSKNSSLAILKPLKADRKDVVISFFHSPEVRGLIKSLLPERINEIIGLQHMKFFIFDDSIIISGANLSDQYFVQRQDRYILLEHSPMLADFFQSVFDIISAHSLQMDSAGDLLFQGDPSVHPFTGSSSEIQKSIKTRLDQLYADFKERLSKRTHQESEGITGETFVCPFLQMGTFNVDQEGLLLRRIFGAEENFEVTLMTAYFNLYDAYADLILRKCHFPIKIVFGSPRTNSFFDAGGTSRNIPSLYVQNVLDFMGQTLASGRDKVTFMEWDRPNWTFHAKGLWVDSLDGAGGMATVVGSSNYGYRSAHRDLEAQVLLFTVDEALKRRIAEERKSLLEYAEPLDVNVFLKRDHLIPAWVKYFARVFKNFF